MMPLLYILTGAAFYWLSYRNAQFVDDNSTTHPQAEQGEVIYLFPEDVELKAA